MAAPYADIFNYILGTAPVDQVTAFSNGSMTVDPKYRDIIKIMDRQSGGDDPSSSQVIDIDYSKLPNAGMTKYGPIGSGAIPAADPNTPVGPGQQSTLKDRKQVYNDPNYGWVTPASNRKVGTLDKVNEYLPYAIMAAASMGFGALAGLPLISQIPALGKTIGGLTGGGGPMPSFGAPVASSSGAGLSSPSAAGKGLSGQKTAQLLRLIRGG